MDAIVETPAGIPNLEDGKTYNLTLRHGDDARGHTERVLEDALIRVFEVQDRHCPSCSCRPVETRYEAVTADATVGFLAENVASAELIE